MFGRTKTVNAKKIDMQISNQLAFLLKSRCTQCGFTILEIIVSLAIVAILTSIAIPRLHSVSAQHEVETTASQMVQQMEAARVFAQANNVTVVACPVATNLLNAPDNEVLANVDNNCAPVIVGTGNGNSNAPQLGNWQAWVWIVDAGGNRAVWQRGVIVPASVIIDAGGLISFDGNARPRGTQQTINIKSHSGGYHKSIVIASFTGRVTLKP